MDAKACTSTSTWRTQHTTRQFRRPSCPAPRCVCVSPHLFRARRLPSALCQSDVPSTSTGRHIGGCYHAVLCTNAMDAVADGTTVLQRLRQCKGCIPIAILLTAIAVPTHHHCLYYGEITRDFSPLIYILPSITWNATQSVRCRVHG